MAKYMVALFSKNERHQAFMLSLLIMLTGVVDTVGVASIVPFMQVVSQPSIVETNPYLNFVYSELGFADTTGFLVFLGVTVLVFMTVANLLKAFTRKTQLSFAWNTASNVSIRLMDRYMHQPYRFYLDKNTMSLGKQVLAECKQLVSSVLMPLTECLSYGVVALAMIALLLVADIVLTLVIFSVLGGAYLLMFLLSSRYLDRLGRRRYDSNKRLYLSTYEALGNIKSVIIRGSQSFFIDRFSEASRTNAYVQARAATLSQVPRYLIEVIAFGGIIAVTIFLLMEGGNMQTIIPKLSLFAVAGYRLMPSLQYIFKNVSAYRFNSHVVEELFKEFSLHTQVPQDFSGEAGAEPADFLEEVVLDRVSFSYPNSGDLAVNNVSLTIEKNKRIGFVGTTGSGKSTLINILVGLLAPTAGEVRVDQTPICGPSVPGWRSKVGYVPQEVVLYDDTVAANIAYGVPASEVDQDRIVEAAKVAGIHKFLCHLPEGYNTPVGERGGRLSGGQRQRVGIARALYHRPEILVLDEATSALDNITEREVIDSIEKQELTIITVAHRLSTVRNCDVICLMQEGRLVAVGSYEELLSQNLHFQEMVSAVAS